MRRFARWLGWLMVFGYFVFALLFLSLRYVILPQIESYRGDIERLLSSSLSLPVAIRQIDANWQGLTPHLGLSGVQIHDQLGRPALKLEHVEADLSWTSFLHLDLRLRRLEILAPDLTIRRDGQGRLFIAGLQLDTSAQTQSSAFPKWLLAQKNIVVRDAKILWQDDLRAAPPLELQHLNFHLQNTGRRHRFGFTAEPPRALAARLDIRGDFVGESLDTLADWQGETYAELDYADLAVWRQWVDYPIELPQGSGALRLWLGFAQKQLSHLSAEIALKNVHLRLARDLPLLDLHSLKGRVSGKQNAQGFEIAAKQLRLQTQDGIRVEPTDFLLRWQAEREARFPFVFRAADAARGEVSANGLDLEALARLAAYLPLDTALRERLASTDPRGKLFDLKADWTHLADTEAPADGVKLSLARLDRFNLSARFERLGLQAQAEIPGVEGISGDLTANERGGTVRLDSQQVALFLPAIFAEPRIELDQLDALIHFKHLRQQAEAEGRWLKKEKSTLAGLEVQLERFDFSAQPATGTVQGRYVLRLPSEAGAAAVETGPGEIDLTARLKRAEANQVWRFIPLVVDRSVRDWLQMAILSGQSSDTTLRLKGDLRHFPFDDGSGIFSVKGSFQHASLRYAPDWPQIDHIQGDLAFVGKSMRIQASRGTLYGVTLTDVKAEIPDLSLNDVILQVRGQAQGPTSDFLRFIATSPVAESIDHFTEEMRAQGNGTLQLKLALPLNHLENSKIEGAYQFAANKLHVDKDLPQLEEVNGRLQFTGDGLKAERVRATLLGMPLVADVKTLGAGTVSVLAEGQFNVAALRRHIQHPMLDHLSGSSPWHGSVQVRKKMAEVTVDSKLQGLSSSLPEPFNKSASDVLPFRFTRKLLQKPAQGGSAAQEANTPLRDQLELSLGQTLAGRFVRRYEGERNERLVWEKGTLAIGDTPRLPDKGVQFAVNLKKIDVDLWRSLLRQGVPNASAPPDVAAAVAEAPRAEASEPLWPFASTAIALKTSELIVFGHRLQDLEVRAQSGREGSQGMTGWRADLRSRDLNGELIWRSQGRGRLVARLKQLAIDDGSAANPVAETGEALQIEQMPGLDIEVEHLAIRGRPLGKLKLSADHRAEVWDARLEIENEDGQLSGTGKWRPSPTQADTQLKFNLTAKNLEKLLGRLGYADALRRGRATLDGQLSWNGTPFALDYPSLQGTLKVDATNGQFNKLEPGVGRLLGVLSLQSLPRRITLDFRDVFSEGFAFDSITGQMQVARGVMSTQNLQIQGPAAKVLMSGSVNLPKETQTLKVRVQPAVGETLAVGAMLANPAAGVVAWLAQKIMRDPLDQVLAFEYAVTGNWADPKVEKLSGTSTAATPLLPLSPSLPSTTLPLTPGLLPAPIPAPEGMTPGMTPEEGAL